MVLHRCHAPQPIHKQPARPINIMHAEMANDYRAFKAAGLLHEWRMKYVAYLPEPDQRIDTLPDRARGQSQEQTSMSSRRDAFISLRIGRICLTADRVLRATLPEPAVSDVR